MAVTDDLAALQAQVERAPTVMGSAKALLDGFQARLAAAASEALANGATAAQIAPFNALGAALGVASDDLTAAVIANTPAAPTA